MLVSSPRYGYNPAKGSLLMTDYFRDEVLPKRAYIRLEWCQVAIAAPVRKEVQPEDGRIRHWIFVLDGTSQVS